MRRPGYLIIAALTLAATACGGKIVPPVFNYKLVSDGPPGGRKTNASYLPGKARDKIRSVAAKNGLRTVEVPEQTPPLFTQVSGGVSVTQKGGVNIVWSDKGSGGELEFATIPDGDNAEGSGFDSVYDLCQRAASLPAKPGSSSKLIQPPFEPDAKPACLNDYPKFGMTLYWSVRGNRFSVRDNRNDRSMDQVIAIAKVRRVNVR